MSMDWYIKPEDIIAEIRKGYPTEKVLTESLRPVAPKVTFANENLYGAIIYVYGEGVKGQYLRHSYFDREGKRYWLISYGWTTVYGRTKDDKILPLVVLGVPTRFVFTYKPSDFKGFKLEEIPVDYIECTESQMINLDRVMRGEDPVLIIDKYDLLQGTPVPTEFMGRIMEQQRIIETLQKTVWEYEKAINDYKTNINILQARIAKMQELLTSYETKLLKLSTEISGIQSELIRLREEIFVRGAETEALEEARRKLRDLMDSLTDVVKDVADWMSGLRKDLELKKPKTGGEGGEK